MSEPLPELNLDDDELLALLDEAGEKAVSAPSLPSGQAVFPEQEDEVIVVDDEPAPVVTDPMPTVPIDQAQVDKIIAMVDKTDAPKTEPTFSEAELEFDSPIKLDSLAAVAPPVPSAAEVIKSVKHESPTITKAPRDSSLNYHVDIEAFKALISVTDLNLDEQMARQAGDRAYYAAQAANAEAQHARMKARFEVIEAQLYDKHRKALAGSGEKVTEKMVESAVLMDPAWLAAKTAVIDADTIANIHRNAIVKALDDRRDMMIQLGADRRNDKQGQLRTMAANSEDGVAKVSSAVELDPSNRSKLKETLARRREAEKHYAALDKS